MLPILESTGLKGEIDFFVAHSPERVDPGNARFTTKNTSKVVGGVGPNSQTVAFAFYSQTIDRVIPVSSANAAEMVKVFENTFRAVNIGMVNELSQLCYTLGIDSWEVIEAAATKPFGFMAFYPGPGIGGHCIPLDPHYLSWKARMHGFEARFISLAEEVNSTMPQHIVALVSTGLNRHRKSVNGAKILILGVAYKRDIDDMRESPALPIIEKLEKLGAEISFHDPHVNEVIFETGHRMTTVPLTEEVVTEADCVVIVTDHRSIDYRWVIERAKLIVDSRNTTKDFKNTEFAEKIIRL